MADPIHLALIDDDEAVLDALRHYLARRDTRTSCFKSAKDFLASLDRAERFDCVVSDVRMPGMSGLDLVQHFNECSYAWPIILITGHGDVDMAVTAIKNGAFDFIEKPFDVARLLDCIHRAVEKTRQSESVAAELEKLQSRFDALSARQRQVMELVVTGLSSKEIGIKLTISPKTVENHRAWVMERVGARNVAELIRMAMSIRAHKERLT
jgi:FixJ family two-component response regulator